MQTMGDEIKQSEGSDEESTVLSTNILAGLPIAGDIRILSGDRHLRRIDEHEGGVKVALDRRSELAERSAVRDGQ